MAARFAFFLLAAASAVLAAPTEPAAACPTTVQNFGFEKTPAGQDQTSPSWKVKGSPYSFFNNSNSPTGIQTPYGQHAAALQPNFCDHEVLSQNLCLKAGTQYVLTYSYNLYEVESNAINNVEALKLTVKYAGAHIDSFEPSVPAPGTTNTVWSSRSASFTPTVSSGSLEFNWGVIELSCEDSTVVNSVLGLDQIRIAVALP